MNIQHIPTKQAEAPTNFFQGSRDPQEIAKLTGA